MNAWEGGGRRGAGGKKIRPSGAALLIAIVFTSALVFVAIGLADTFVSGIRDSRDFYVYKQTKYAAQGVSNITMQKMFGKSAMKKGANFSTTEKNQLEQSINLFLDAIPLCVSPGSGIKSPCKLNRYDVYAASSSSQSQVNLGSSPYYSVPSSGIGDVAQTCEFDVNGNGAIEDIDRKNANNPCHWNKLFLKNPREIPLFYYDQNGALVNPADPNGLSSIKFRLRIPCREANGKFVSWCNSGDRPTLYPDSTQSDKQRDYRFDETLVQWQITAEVPEGFGGTLFPLAFRQGTSPADISIRSNHLDNYNQRDRNSQIYASYLSAIVANNWIALQETSYGRDIAELGGTIFNFLKEFPAEKKLQYARANFDWDKRTLSKPHLQFELISPPRIAASSDADGNSSDASRPYFHEIPYLEYQLLADKPIADEKIYGETSVTIRGITQTQKIEKKYPVLSFGFTVQESSLEQ